MLNDSCLQSRLVEHIQTPDLLTFALGTLIVVCIRTFDCLGHIHPVIFYRPGFVLSTRTAFASQLLPCIVMLTFLGLTLSGTCISPFRLVLLGRGFASHSATSLMILDSLNISKLLTFSLSHSVPLSWCVFAPLTALDISIPSYFADQLICISKGSWLYAFGVSRFAAFHVTK